MPGQPQPNAGIQALVVDSGPLIKGHLQPLARRAAAFFTVPEVMLELRDRQTRESLAVVPFDLSVRAPSEEAMAAVFEFSKKTGDFASLSMTDMKVLALTWMLEKERNGTANIRTQPLSASTAIGGKALEKKAFKDEPVATQQETTDAKESETESTQANEASANQVASSEAEAQQLEKDQNDSSADASESHSQQFDESANEIVEQQSTQEQPQHADEQESVQDQPQTNQDDESDGEWITPSNIARHKARDMHGAALTDRKSKSPTVACATTDFAMQNVLLQMNLGVVSVDGMVVRTLKSWLLRCHACYRTCKDMARKFCPACGNNTLMRTSYSVDAQGRVTLHLKRNFQYNIRGTKYSIPNPKGGRNADNLILREDQKEFVKAVKNQKRTEKKLLNAAMNALDIDASTFGERSAKSDAGLFGMTGAPMIGHGRRNVNEARHGKRRK